jgi:mono/diheme cytochrome c family protein
LQNGRSGLLVLAALGLAACAHQEQEQERAGGQAEAGLALPPGAGRALLERECLNCHELDALTLFSGFYDRDRWRSLVLTMRGNGAKLDDAEVEIIADYLARNYGTGVD